VIRDIKNKGEILDENHNDTTVHTNRTEEDSKILDKNGDRTIMSSCKLGEEASSPKNDSIHNCN
jgi:hypothetical protein